MNSNASNRLDLEVMEHSHQPLRRCYQCRKCTCGCPVAHVMDLMPHQVVRYTQLNLEEELLKSKTIWLCAACRTCVSRCPNGIDIAAINDTYKQKVLAKGRSPASSEIAAFHKAFLNSVKGKGRVHELGMMIAFKLKTNTYFQDIPLGLKMFRRNKLRLLPEKVKNLKALKSFIEAGRRED